ncbi:LysR family transcriptional regulator [Kineosporia sp. R_H_3]|uniref:LysR family transcriptional regulator n=1 Tax=Kineosporia sp. R_H_3 TaxID=1961848 RepID=UPI000B4AF445|nr:LysR family transcriptional regulator [Kineosporia sp. R_H_3]
MTESRWKALIEVAETGSIRAAAARLVVTESAVSASVASLSKELGLPLLTRSGRGVELTAAGARYVEYLRRVLGLLEEGGVAARGEFAPEHGRLRLGCVTTVGDSVVPTLLGRFHAAFPAVELALEVGPSARVWSLFEAHRLDVVVAGRPPQLQDVVPRALCDNRLVVVGSPSVADAFDLAATTWLLREDGSGIRGAADQLRADLAASGPAMTLGSNGAVLAGAVAGLGVTLVPHEAAAGHVATGDLAVLDLPGTPLVRPWFASTRHGPTATAALFVRFLLSDPEAGRRWSAVPARPHGPASPVPSPGGGRQGLLAAT